MASDMLHESSDVLAPETIDRHRAIVSIMEELEAIDWYDQRVDAATDAELKAILAHNRDEEKEHASMVLEWLRRRDSKVDQFFREYLFSEGSITEREQESESGGATTAGSETRAGSPRDAVSGGTSGCSLGIGSLRSELGR